MGSTTLRAPAGCSAASVGGITYLVEDGHVAVPTEDAPALLEHGFVIADAVEDKPRRRVKSEKPSADAEAVA